MTTHHERLCAREGCHQPVYTGNALCLQSSIGSLIVYVCAQHLAEYLQASMAARHVSVSMEQREEQKV